MHRLNGCQPQILSSRNFESFWLDKAKRLKLSHTCIERYNPNDTFLEYECSTPYGSEGGGSPRPSTSDQETMTDPDRMHPTQLPTPITEDDEYEDEDDDISPEAAALAHRLGGEGAPIQSPVDSGVPSFDPRYVELEHICIKDFPLPQHHFLATCYWNFHPSILHAQR